MNSHEQNSGQLMPNQQWRDALLMLAIAILVFAGLFWPSFASMVDIWLRSETFAHGFLIFPISAWLIWRMKSSLASLAPQPTLLAVPLIVVVGLAWLLARFTDIAVGEQLTAIAMLVCLVFALLGWQVTKEMIFPLGFLFLAVPMGEDLIPPMMNFTADFTVGLLKLTGIPVFREGTFFEIPTGRWSVVEGCSGVRYLIASVTLGVLYAYLMYRSRYRRIIFIVISIIVPIIANSLRAYMIVMIAHLSDMRLALGVDHFIYGWVFFGVVIMLLFWIGSFWREDQDVGTITSSVASEGLMSRHQRVGILLATLAAVAVWPAWAIVSERSGATSKPLLPPIHIVNWKETQEITEWRPHVIGMDAELTAFYQMQTVPVMMYLAYYNDQRPGAELVNSRNFMVRQKHPVWRQIDTRSIELQVNGKKFSIRQTALDLRQQHLLVYHWNWFEGLHSSNDLEVKWHEALARLVGKPRRGAVIVIAVPYIDQPEDVAPVLESFIRDALPSIEQTLQEASHD